MARDARLQLSWNPSLGNLFMEVTMKGILNMVLEVNQIAGKYISKLEQKKFLKVVKLNDATSAIKQAVDDAASIAKKDIIEAVEPLKNKIAQKDEFISNQKITNQVLQNQYDKLQQTNSSLQTELAKEKYGTQTLSAQNEKLQLDLKKQKNENKSLQTELDEQNMANQSLQNKNTKLNAKNSSLQTMLEKYTSIVKEAYKQGITPEIREQKSGIANILTGLIKHKSEATKPKENTKLVMPKTTNINPKTVITKPEPDTIISAKAPLTKEEVISKIREERKNQVLDKKRINIASSIIKNLFGDVSPANFEDLWARYKNLKSTDFSNILNKHPDLSFDVIKSSSYITFYFNNKKDGMPYLEAGIDAYYKQHTFTIYDKNYKRMITTVVRNGVTNYLDVKFNNVKIIPEVQKNNNEIIDFTKNVTSKHANKNVAKLDFNENKAYNTFKIKKEYQNKTYFELTFPREALKIIQTTSHDIDGVNHATYQKHNYGLLTHPLTKSFTYFGLAKRQNIKPWDFSMLNNYIK